MDVTAALLLVHLTLTWGRSESPCQVSAHVASGWLCGRLRTTDAGNQFASFRGVPYAKQPLGELRFKELEPVEPWTNFYDATREGPICPQTDIFYEFLRPQGMSEACIHANVHVPIHALPMTRLVRDLKPPYVTAYSRVGSPKTGLPILVFIHGGGFGYGSGDANLHGPELLINKDVIVITFNYRLNVLGFLSLNNSRVSGNAGLRDAVTLLRWVQQNARAFGGDPDNVTVGGQSAGAAMTHILTLSPAAEGLFKRAILMSGTSMRSFYTPSPIYAQYVSSQLLSLLAINSTDSEEVFDQLVTMPINRIVDANRQLQDLFGTLTFTPVIESKHEGVTTILDDDPEILTLQGRGSNIPLIIGFTTEECEVFRPRMEMMHVLDYINANPLLVTPPSLAFSRPPEIIAKIAEKVKQEYLKEVTMDNYLKLCSDMSFEYPALKIAELRAQIGGAAAYLYQFAYESDLSYFKRMKNLEYDGVGHVEDLTYLFNATGGQCRTCGHKLKYVSYDQVGDDLMKDWMTTLVSHFMQHSTPAEQPRFWPAASSHDLQYQDLKVPAEYRVSRLSPRQVDVMWFFDSMRNIS